MPSRCLHTLNGQFRLSYLMGTAMGISRTLGQVAFVFAFLNCLIVVWTVCKIIHFLPGLGTKQKRHEYSIAASSLGFRYLMLMPCPWLRLHGLQELEKRWKEVSGDGAPYIIANHNSKLDSLLITALLPTWIGPKMRSLIKEALFYEPLFGGICSAVGHFPVYFRGSADGDFGVNKEAQVKVSADMDRFVANGGGLLIFPEGQLNKSPRKLQTLRRGAFSLPIAHKKAVWGFVNVGCEEAWPRKSAIGGFPSDIYVRLFKITDNAADFDNAGLAEYAGAAMQAELDKLYSIVDGNKDD